MENLVPEVKSTHNNLLAELFVTRAIHSGGGGGGGGGGQYEFSVLCFH